MNQALYAHMNNKRKRKKKRFRVTKKKSDPRNQKKTKKDKKHLYAIFPSLFVLTFDLENR
jgi:hypothetical protein